MLGFRIVRIGFHIADSIIPYVRAFESLHLRAINNTDTGPTRVKPERERRLPQ